MRVFQRVVDEAGFAAAARSLDMSPAAVTRMVSDLEQHLGTRLMQRTTRKFALTEAGEAYLQRVRGILNDIAEAEAAAAASTRELQGVIHVLATPVLASYFLAPVVARWRDRHPKVALDIVVDPFPQGRVEEFDVTFLILEHGADASVVARPLSTSEWVVCASPAYLQRRGHPRTPQELAQHDYLRFPWQYSASQNNRRLSLKPVQPGLDPVEVDMPVALQSASVDALYRAALDGAGIAMLSRLLVAPNLANGSLVHLLPEWVFGRFTIYAALPTRKLVPARTRAFIDFLAEVAPRLSSAQLGPRRRPAGPADRPV